jgi:hypothetical protein
LKRIEPGAVEPAASAAGDGSPTRASSKASDTTEDTIIAKIEGIARLHAKGVLSDADFSAKKAELLARL